MSYRIMQLFVLAALALPTAALPQDKAAIQADFDHWLAQEIWPMAQLSGIRKQTFDQALAGIKINWDLPHIVVPGTPDNSSQFQAEFRAPARYFDSEALSYTVSLGQKLGTQYADVLDKVQADTGVPADILLTIWGRESSFGKADIPHNAFEILSTKGFLDPRADYFTQELIAALHIIEQGHASLADMKSSWAGALGQPQFMPTNYLTYGADGNNDGKVDIWTSEADTLASIAAYLKQHGWNPDQNWGVEVMLPSAASCAFEGPDRGKRASEWAQLGITTLDGAALPSGETFLLLPAGRFGPAFIVTENFYVLKAYNESDAYALFIGHVADRIARNEGDFRGVWQPLDPVTRGDIIALQTELEVQGYDVGGVDGLIGYKTRRSIGQWQAQNAIEQTCYPDQPTLVKLLE